MTNERANERAFGREAKLKEIMSKGHFHVGKKSCAHGKFLKLKI